MKALSERLECLRLAILDGMPDPDAREHALDLCIEAAAIADALPEITIAGATARPPMSRVVPKATQHRPPWDAVVAGGRSSTL